MASDTEPVQNSTPLDRLIYSILGDYEEMVLIYFSYFSIGWTMIVAVALMTSGKARYGRYRNKKGANVSLSPNVAWMIDTMPSFLIPVIIAGFTEAKQLSNTANVVCLAMFIAHYFHRSFIYSLSIRGNTPVPQELFIFSVIFTSLSGVLHSRHLTKYSVFGEDWIQDPRFIIGCILFVVGMAINVHSDHLLHNLRKPGETGYKIPRGGLFEYVSGANYFGECVEWTGFAIACWSLTGIVMPIGSLCNIGPRALHHHEYYHRKFEDYPKDRKAFIPFII